MVQALSTFMDFCYLVWQNVLDESTLDAIDVAITKFHTYHIVFKDVGVHSNFSLPCQHSVKHFWLLIQMFGALNVLCSSITESKHIKAVKEPYWCSSHFEALGQMLLTNQRIDKLEVYHVSLTSHNMLNGPNIIHVVPPLPLPALALPRHDPDNEAVNMPQAITSVLARTRGKSAFLLV